MPRIITVLNQKGGVGKTTTAHALATGLTKPYMKIMAGITGKSVTQYINDIVTKDAAANAERYQKAKELMEDAR